MWKNVGWLAKHYGVSRITIGNWIRAGKFSKVDKTKGGHYRVWFDSDRIRRGYCRVSSAKQKSSLDRQAEIIRSAYPDIEIETDIGSGFNFKRPRFRTLLEQCLQGTAVEIVVVTGDRLSRVGLPFIRWIVELHGGCVTELEASDSDETFDTAELVGFVTSFIASYHGKRSGRRKKSTRLPG